MKAKSQSKKLPKGAPRTLLPLSWSVQSWCPPIMSLAGINNHYRNGNPGEPSPVFKKRKAFRTRLSIIVGVDPEASI